MHRYLTPRFWAWAAQYAAIRVRHSPRNILREYRLRRALRTGHALDDLTAYERRVFSQNGEDGIIDAIFRKIGPTNRYFVEFGVQDGSECNTRLLAERHGWRGLLMDGGHENSDRSLRREFITAENINDLFARYAVPAEFDLLSIDIDGNDYWVWRALDTRFRPRVVIIEYNAAEGPERVSTIEYAPAFRWGGTDYMGASLGALVAVSRDRGYTLVACDSRGVNAFFVRNDLVPGNFQMQPVGALFRPVRFGRYFAGHTPDPHRRLLELDGNTPTGQQDGSA